LLKIRESKNEEKIFDFQEASLSHSYDLKGIIVHYGTGMHFGHYWSLSRSIGPNPKWIEYDD